MAPLAQGRRGGANGQPLVRSVLAALRRLPLSIPAASTIAGFQAVTAAGPGLHPALLRTFGLHWPSLAAFQLHRVAASALVQPNPGFSLAGMLAAAAARRQWNGAWVRAGWRSYSSGPTR